VPFICLPAGTRSDFALDLGIVRHDLLGALDAVTAGSSAESTWPRSIGRPFLNNISLGVYGDAVQRSG
jgi:diacylglycerol kinase family enzyme